MNSLKMSILNEVPTKDTIYKWFENLIKDIKTDIWNDFMELDEMKWEDWRKFYKTTYENLLDDYSKHKKILGLKRNLKFEELCEFYNLMIEIYKQVVDNTSLENSELLNKRTSLYHIFLKWDMDEVFKFNIEEK